MYSRKFCIFSLLWKLGLLTQGFQKVSSWLCSSRASETLFKGRVDTED